MITLQLTDSLSVIESNVNAALSDVLNRYINLNLNKIIIQCKNLVGSWISSQPEMISLVSSDIFSLAGQFGIPSGGRIGAVNAIVNSVVESTSVKFVKFNKQLRGGLEVYFQPSNFINLLSLPQGHVIYQSGNLHWLDWLLRRGDSIIVANYEYNPESGLGRSSLGNMVEGGSFRVPPEYSGIESNNFITRALIGEAQEKQIAQIFKNILGGK